MHRVCYQKNDSTIDSTTGSTRGSAIGTNFLEEDYSQERAISTTTAINSLNQLSFWLVSRNPAQHLYRQAPTGGTKNDGAFYRIGQSLISSLQF